MIEFSTILIGLLGGLFVGIIFFSGLHWTVQRMGQVNQPVLFFLTSFLLRTAIVLVGFYLISAGSWQRLLMMMLGFFIARIILVRVLPAPDNDMTKEVNG